MHCFLKWSRWPRLSNGDSWLAKSFSSFIMLNLKLQRAVYCFSVNKNLSFMWVYSYKALQQLENCYFIWINNSCQIFHVWLVFNILRWIPKVPKLLSQLMARLSARGIYLWETASIFIYLSETASIFHLSISNCINFHLLLLYMGIYACESH